MPKHKDQAIVVALDTIEDRRWDGFGLVTVDYSSLFGISLFQSLCKQWIALNRGWKVKCVASFGLVVWNLFAVLQTAHVPELMDTTIPT